MHLLSVIEGNEVRTWQLVCGSRRYLRVDSVIYVCVLVGSIAPLLTVPSPSALSLSVVSASAFSPLVLFLRHIGPFETPNLPCQAVCLLVCVGCVLSPILGFFFLDSSLSVSSSRYIPTCPGGSLVPALSLSSEMAVSFLSSGSVVIVV